jgi:hypothetical protein
MNILEEEEQHQWTAQDIADNRGQGPIEVRTRTEPSETPQPRLPIQTSQATSSHERSSETPTRNVGQPQTRFQTYATDERITQEPQEYRHFATDPYPYESVENHRQPSQATRQSTTQPVRRSRHDNEDHQGITSPVRQPSIASTLINLMKVYQSDEKKYGGDQYDILDTKLFIFYDLCGKVGVEESYFDRAFSSMLKGRALEFYYDKIIGREYTFVQMVDMIRTHFETEENRQKYLSEWRETTLMSTVRKHPDKTRLECLELMLDNLRAAQRGLSVQYQTEHTLRDQVLNACRGVPECNLALFKPAPTFEGLCADLRAAIATATRTRETAAFYQQEISQLEYDQHFTDRTFGGQAKRYPPKPVTAPVRSNFSRPAQQLSFAPRSQYSNRSNSTIQKCYVCKKPGCWSTKHTDQERKDAFSKAKESFTAALDWSSDEVEQFLAQYEGQEDPENVQEIEISLHTKQKTS